MLLKILKYFKSNPSNIFKLYSRSFANNLFINIFGIYWLFSLSQTFFGVVGSDLGYETFLCFSIGMYNLTARNLAYGHAKFFHSSETVAKYMLLPGFSNRRNMF